MNHLGFHQLFPVISFGQPGHKNGKAGTAGSRRPGKEKKGPGPDQHLFPISEGTPEKHPGHAAQRSLVEKGEKGAGGGKNGHDFVKVVAQIVKERHLIHLPVFQDQGKVLDAENPEIAGEAEGHFREHGMDIGMPEDKPAPQRLPDIDGQNQAGRSCNR